MKQTLDPSRVSAVDRLAERIRAFVAQQGLQLGDPLPTERELGEIFAASRNTVREALVVLRAYGLIETRPKVGAVIADGHAQAVRRLFSFHNGISPDSFRDLQGYRRMLETAAGEFAVIHAAPGDLVALEAINDRMLQLESVADLAACDYDFHEGLVALGGNNTAMASYRLLKPVILDLMRIGKSARPVRDDTHQAHRAIVGALRARDRIAYAYLMGQHLEYGLQFLPQGPALQE